MHWIRKQCDMLGYKTANDVSKSQQWELETCYSETRLDTIETNLQCFLNYDPKAFFERLYAELVMWRHTFHPSLSPLDHPKAFFESCCEDMDSISKHIWFGVGVASQGLLTRANVLHKLTVQLKSCVVDFALILTTEDILDDIFDTNRLYLPVEEKYKLGKLQYQNGVLERMYQDIYL
ncbi:hypothetical protein PQX77_020699 [Marasmius sp. AFHP31]|nr:hypothetical protein PQX77_020699 [Marasmius sp. AFHP31]